MKKALIFHMHQFFCSFMRSLSAWEEGKIELCFGEGGWFFGFGGFAKSFPHCRRAGNPEHGIPTVQKHALNNRNQIDFLGESIPSMGPPSDINNNH